MKLFWAVFLPGQNWVHLWKNPAMLCSGRGFRDETHQETVTGCVHSETFSNLSGDGACSHWNRLWVLANRFIVHSLSNNLRFQLTKTSPILGSYGGWVYLSYIFPLSFHKTSLCQMVFRLSSLLPSFSWGSSYIFFFSISHKTAVQLSFFFFRQYF